MNQKGLSFEFGRAFPRHKDLRLIVESRQGYSMLTGKLLEETRHRSYEKRPLVLSAGAAVEEQQDVIGGFSGLEALYLARLPILQHGEVLADQIGDWLPDRIVHEHIHGNRL